MPFFRSFAKLVTHRREKNPIMINYYGETFASTAMNDCRDDGEGYDFPRDYDCDCEDHTSGSSSSTTEVKLALCSGYSS